MSDVYVYIYDLSMGMARSVSVSLIGTQIEGIWHTGVVVYGKEIFYGAEGISQCQPCGTPLKEPLRKEFVGRTTVTNEELTNYLRELSLTLFKGGHYRLFDHNCNTFSEHLVYYLTKQHIPNYVLDLPQIVASTPLGAVLKPALNALSAGIDADPLFGAKQHSFKEIRRSFKPILYVEPLTSELGPSSIDQFWRTVTADATSSMLAGKAKRLAEAVSSVGLVDMPSDVDQFQLLDVDQLETCDQAFIALELFRLAIWQEPSLMVAMLTDPRRSLHRLPLAKLPSNREAGGISPLDTEMARCKLLCNYVGLSSEWEIAGESADDTGLLLKIEPVVHIALMLLGHSDHLRRPGGNAVIDPTQLVPQHRQAGLMLAYNLALHPGLSELYSIELGTYLIHLAVEKDKCYTQPTEAIYLVRTIYFLVIRFPLLADYARSCDLQGCLTVVLSEVTSPSSSDPRAGVSSVAKTSSLSSGQGKGTSESGSSRGSTTTINVGAGCYPDENPDFDMVSYLIDFLNSD